ncbi:MAG: helix-turn-helix domain-containing protein [Clostridiales bacterium]|nr:helix-turn-helix domain-containing protein [Clostridiales bacterium]
MRQTIGQFLATMRKSKGYTQQEVADRLGVSNRTLSAWETDKVYPDILALPALAELYGITVDEILKGARNSPTNMPEQPQPNLSEKAYKSVLKKKLSSFNSTLSIAFGLGVGDIALLITTFFIYFASAILGIIFTVLTIGIAIAAFVLFLTCFSTAKSSFDSDEDFEELNAKYFLFTTDKLRKNLLVLGILSLIACAITTFILATYFDGIPFVFSIVTALLAIILILPTSIYKNNAVLNYGNEAQKNCVRANNKLLKLIAIIATIPIILGIAASILFLNWFPSWKNVIYSAKFDDFKNHMQTLIVEEGGRYTAGFPLGEYEVVIPELPGDYAGEYFPLNNGLYASINANDDKLYIGYKSPQGETFITRGYEIFEINGKEFYVIRYNDELNTSVSTPIRNIYYEIGYDSVTDEYRIFEKSILQAGPFFIYTTFIIIIAEIVIGGIIYAVKHKKIEIKF